MPEHIAAVGMQEQANKISEESGVEQKLGEPTILWKMACSFFCILDLNKHKTSVCGYVVAPFLHRN